MIFGVNLIRFGGIRVGINLLLCINILLFVFFNFGGVLNINCSCFKALCVDGNIFRPGGGIEFVEINFNNLDATCRMWSSRFCFGRKISFGNNTTVSISTSVLVVGMKVRMHL